MVSNGAAVGGARRLAACLLALLTFSVVFAGTPGGLASETAPGPAMEPVGGALVRLDGAAFARLDPALPFGSAYDVLDEVAAASGVPAGLVEGLLAPDDVTQSPTGTHVRLAGATVDDVRLVGVSGAVHYDTDGRAWLASLDVPAHLPPAWSLGPLDADAVLTQVAGAATTVDWRGSQAADLSPYTLGIQDRPLPVWHHMDGDWVGGFDLVVAPHDTAAVGPESAGWFVRHHPGHTALDIVLPRWEAATGNGRVFDPSPEVTAADPDFVDNANGSEDGRFTGLIFQRDLHELNEPNGTQPYTLHGPWVRVETDTSSSDLDFRFQRSDIRFEDVMSYAHMDFAQRENQRLGFQINDEPQRVLEPDMGLFNAYYAWDDYIVFGYHAETENGLADAAEDADVVVHEYAHAVQLSLFPDSLTGVEDRSAIAEGWADLYSALILLPANDDYDPACLGDWFGNYLDDDQTDGVSHCFRRLDNAYTYADVVAGMGGHAGGQVLSGMAWNITQAHGRDVALSLFLEANHLFPSSGTDMRDFAEAVLHASDGLYAGAYNETVAWSAFDKELDTAYVAALIGQEWDDLNPPGIHWVEDDLASGGWGRLQGRKLMNNSSIEPRVFFDHVEANVTWYCCGSYVEFRVPELARGNYTVSLERDDGEVFVYDQPVQVGFPKLYDTNALVWPGMEASAYGRGWFQDDNGAVSAHYEVDGQELPVLDLLLEDDDYAEARFIVPDLPSGTATFVLTTSEGDRLSIANITVTDPLVVHERGPFHMGAGETMVLTGEGLGAAPHDPARTIVAYARVFDAGFHVTYTRLPAEANEDGTNLTLGIPENLTQRGEGLELLRSDGAGLWFPDFFLNQPDLAVEVHKRPDGYVNAMLPGVVQPDADWVFAIRNVGKGAFLASDPGIHRIEFYSFVTSNLSQHWNDGAFYQDLAPGEAILVPLDVHPAGNKDPMLGEVAVEAYIRVQDWSQNLNRENDEVHDMYRFDPVHELVGVPGPY